MMDQKEAILNSREERNRSRSRSRDRQNKFQKYKSLIIKSVEDEDALYRWSSKDTQILEQLLSQKLDEEQTVRKFKRIKLANKRPQVFQQKGQFTYQQYLEKEKQFHDEQELARPFFRMQHGTEQPVDRFIKAVYIYKGKMQFQNEDEIVNVMKNPKQYLENLSAQQLNKMLPEVLIHSKADLKNKTQFVEYWNALTQLVQDLIIKKSGEQETMTKQTEQRVAKIMNKSLSDLLKMEKSIISNQKQNNADNSKFWNSILNKIKVIKLESTLTQYYNRFKLSCKQEEAEERVREPRIITSPILHSKDIIAAKFVVTQESQIAERTKTAERIFKQNFEKAVTKLENNLSLPKNHTLLQENIITDVNATYDQIAEQILEFERYKRLDEDEENFNDWLPVQTEGRFRDRKPEYVNRVRMSFEWNRYNQLHYTTDNPPPKTVQGYKFNIFYPHLLDKTKTPQYYLQPTETTDFAIIKFKAGPPYLDVAFRIVNREWDFSEKSGFESIFAKGILHLYFNFKKPGYRI